MAPFGRSSTSLLMMPSRPLDAREALELGRQFRTRRERHDHTGHFPGGGSSARSLRRPTSHFEDAGRGGAAGGQCSRCKSSEQRQPNG